MRRFARGQLKRGRPIGILVPQGWDGGMFSSIYIRVEKNNRLMKVGGDTMLPSELKKYQV